MGSRFGHITRSAPMSFKWSNNIVRECDLIIIRTTLTSCWLVSAELFSSLIRELSPLYIKRYRCLTMSTLQQYRISLQTCFIKLPLTFIKSERVVDSQLMSAMLNGFVFSYCLTFGMAFLVSSFVILPLKERSNGSKHIQFISGISARIFWFSAYVWDLFSFALPSLLVLIVVVAFRIDAYVAGSHIWYTGFKLSFMIITC